MVASAHLQVRRLIRAIAIVPRERFASVPRGRRLPVLLAQVRANFRGAILSRSRAWTQAASRGERHFQAWAGEAQDRCPGLRESENTSPRERPGPDGMGVDAFQASEVGCVGVGRQMLWTKVVCDGATRDSGVRSGEVRAQGDAIRWQLPARALRPWLAESTKEVMA